MTEMEPDLSKPPPHLEGYLLKQNSRAFIQVGRRAWKNYFFVIRKEKLLYFKKRDDFQSQNDPVSVIFLSRITEITECVHKAVPKKHHVNCGFQIVSHDDTFNLLAESPRDAHHWVTTLKYIKEYWSRMEVRNTVLTAEQEKEFVRRALEDEEDDIGTLIGYYNEDFDTVESATKTIVAGEDESFQMTVTFEDSSQVSIRINPSSTARELLDSVKAHLTSSASLLWVVNGQGEVNIFSPDEPLQHYSEHSDCGFYALNPSHVVLVLFFKESEFKCIIAPTSITAQQVINHPTIATHRDKLGISKCRLFFDGKEGETVFLPQECPCDILFAVNEHGAFNQINSGKLFVKNSTVGGGLARHTTTYRARFSSIHPGMKHRGVRGAIQKQMIEEEEARRFVLDKLASVKVITSKRQNTSEVNDSNMEIVPPSDRKIHRRNSPVIRQKKTGDSRKRPSSTDHKLNVSNRSPSGVTRAGNTRKSLASLAAEVAAPSVKVSTNIDKDNEICQIDGEELGSNESTREPYLKLNVPLLLGDDDEEEERLASLFDGFESTYQSGTHFDADALVLSLAKKCHKIESQLPLGECPPLSPISFKLETQDPESESMDISSKHRRIISEDPIPVYGIAFLKEILREDPSDDPERSMDMNLNPKCGISLSGKTLMKTNGNWLLAGDDEFNRDVDMLQTSNSILSEELVLPGGIRALYDYSENRWFVLPPLDSGRQGQNVVFSLDEETSDLMANKKIFCQNVQSPVESILMEFQHARTAAEKEEIGNELTNPRVGQLLRYQLCPALAAVVNDGRKPYRYQGLIEVSLWEAVYQLNEGGFKVDRVYERARKHAQEVNVHPLIESPSMKFRTFMVLLLRDCLLAEWIEKLPLLQDILKKDYIGKSFLRLSEPGGKTSGIYRDISIALDPLMKLPFAIDMMFEFKQWAEPSTVTINPPSEPICPNLEETKAVLQENANKRGVPWLSDASDTNDLNEGDQCSGKKSSMNWFQKISSNISLQELNRGGALTGRPKSRSEDNATKKHSRRSTAGSKWYHQVKIGGGFWPSRPPSSQETVTDQDNVSIENMPVTATENPVLMIALFDSISDRMEELSVAKGDIVSVEQKVDDNWLLCISKKNGNRGLVPSKYLQHL